MPRFDGTGPAGMGPMTGRGLGPCGYGRGCGRGYGRGLGYYRQPTATEEKQMIQDDVAALREELKAAEERLSQLENGK